MLMFSEIYRKTLGVLEAPHPIFPAHTAHLLLLGFSFCLGTLFLAVCASQDLERKRQLWQRKALIKWFGHKTPAAVYLPQTVGVCINNSMG